MKGPEKRGASRAARVARRLGKAFGYALLALLGLMVLLLACVNLAPVRNFVAARTNAALSETFAGRVSIERIGAIGWRGVSGVDARGFDAAGKQVLDVHGASVSLPWPRLVWDLLVKKPNPLRIKLDRTALEHADITLRDDGTGAPTLAKMFLPRKPSVGPPSNKETVVTISAIEVGHAWVHGSLAAMPTIDSEVYDLAGRLDVDPSATALELGSTRLTLRGLPIVQSADGRLSGRVKLARAAGERELEVRFAGHLAGSALSLDAALKAQRVSALVHAVAPAEAVQRLVPSLSLRGSSELVAKASGTLPDLGFEARVLSAAGRVELTGNARLGPATRGRCQLRVSHFDASALKPTLPESDIDLELSAQAALRGGELTGGFELLVPAGRLDGQKLPSAAGGGEFSRDERGPLRVAGRLGIDEPGAPTSIDYDLALGSRSWLEASSQTWLTRPARLVELSGVSVAGVLETRLRIDLDRKRLAGSLNAALPRVVQGRNHVEQLRVQASISGSPAAPELEVSADAARVVALERRFENARVRIARLGLAPELSLKNCTLALTRKSTTLQAHLSELSLGHGLRVEGLALDTGGSAWLSFTWHDGLERLRARAQNIDLARLARALDLKTPIEHGAFSLEANIERQHGKPNGIIIGSVRELDVGAIGSGRFDLSMAVRDGRVTGAVVADLIRAGKATLTLEDVPLLQPPYGRKTLERLTGRIGVDGDLDLAALDRLFSNEQVPLERASGRVTFDAELDRSSEGDALPNLVARVEIEHVELVGKRHPLGPHPTAREAKSAAPRQLRPLDLRADLRLESESGKAWLRVRSHDNRGALLELDAISELPKTLSQALRADVRELPVQARLVIPPQALAAAPLAALSGAEGHASLELELEGTARDPKLKISGRVASFRPLEAHTDPLDLEVHAEVERAGGRIAADAFVKQSRVGTLRGAWQGDLSRLPEATLEEGPVQGSASIDLRDFPLAAIPGTSLHQLRGALSGHLELEDFGKDARLNGSLQARPLRFGEARFEEVLATVSMAGEKLKAVLRLQQTEGSAQGTLAADYVWGARPLPSVETPLEAQLSAKALHLTGLAQLAPGTINEIDGRLDADLEGRFGDGEPFLRGSLTLHDGVVQEPRTGQRFHGIDALVKLVPGQVRVEQLTARGSAGRLRATAAAHLNGLSLTSAEAHVSIREKEKIPITVEGVVYGDAFGKVDASLRVDERQGTEIRVDVPEMTLDLPESAGTEPQPLEPAEYVRVGTRQRDGELVTLPLQPLAETRERSPGPPTVIVVKVSPKARLRKGTMFDVQFGGQTRIELAERPIITGQINMTGGKFDVQGKLFDIERGTVTFDGSDSSNPTVLATARWDSPADYSVTVEYAGTVRQGQLTLASEPPLTQDEILSLLMFGNPEGSQGSSSGSAAAAAFGVAGGTAVKGVNRVINRLTNLDLDARVDTSTGSARPELVLQLTPRMSARVTRALGEPAPGQPPDRTFATLDLRLGGRWSLATTVGDRGASAVDLIWRLRY